MIKGETSVETLFKKRSCGCAESFKIKVSVISCDVIIGAINRVFTFVTLFMDVRLRIFDYMMKQENIEFHVLFVPS